MTSAVEQVTEGTTTESTSASLKFRVTLLSLAAAGPAGCANPGSAAPRHASINAPRAATRRARNDEPSRRAAAD
jgi:hypothetical protein